MELLNVAVNAIASLNLSDIKIYQTNDVTPLFDYVIIATASSIRQMDAVISHLDDEVHKNGYSIRGEEGKSGGTWVLVDLNSILVNVFYQDEREKYDLDRLWRHLPQVEFSKIVKNSVKN